jgi:hypothetical protein
MDRPIPSPTARAAPIVVGAAALPVAVLAGAPAEPPQPEVAGMGGAPATATTSLPAADPGGQVATGGRVAMLGNRSVSDTPLSTQGYTDQLIQGQQARTPADVLANSLSTHFIHPRFSDGVDFAARVSALTDNEIAFEGFSGLRRYEVGARNAFDSVAAALALPDITRPSGMTCPTTRCSALANVADNDDRISQSGVGSGGFLPPGAPRTYLFSVSADL